MSSLECTREASFRMSCLSCAPKSSSRSALINMKRHLRLLSMAALLWFATSGRTSSQVGGAPIRPCGGIKGNTRAHTLNSDGDSTPEDVVRCCREHGYQFLVLTD